jgi:hypothetical protein
MSKPSVKFIIVTGSISKHIRVCSEPIDKENLKQETNIRRKIISIISFSLN